MQHLWVEFIHRHHVVPREPLHVPKEPSFPIASKYIDVVRQTKPIWTLWKRTASILFWNIGGIWKSQIQHHPKVIHGWMANSRKTQVTSRPGTIWPDVWSSVSKCAQKKAKQHCDIGKQKIDLHVRRRNFTMFLPTTLNNLRPFFRTPRIFGDFQWNQQCHQ